MALLELLASEDETLLVRRDSLFLLNLLFDVFDVVRGLHFQCNGLSREGLDKDLHASAQAQHQVEGGLLLDVVVSQSAAVLQLLAGKDQALLVRGDACEAAGVRQQQGTDVSAQM